MVVSVDGGGEGAEEAGDDADDLAFGADAILLVADSVFDGDRSPRREQVKAIS